MPAIVTNNKSIKLSWEMFISSDVDENRTALAIADGDDWRELTYAQLKRVVEDLSSWLIEQGVNRGDKVAILSESSPEWGVAFFAAIRSGAVVVPVDTKLTKEELVPILSDASPCLMFVSSAYIETAELLKLQVSSLENLVLLDRGNSTTGVPSIAELSAKAHHEEQDRRLDDTAVITYTSGTTGSPKGVMTTFGNLTFQVNALQQLFDLGENDVCLSILPLNHLLELSFGFLGVLSTGGQVCYSATLYPQEITRIMREKKVTRMIVVPLFLKMMKDSVQKEVRRSGPWRRELFRAAMVITRLVPSRPLKRILFSSVHSRFGGALSEFVSGGAALDSEVAQFFDRMGFSVYQGYGLTETSPGVSVNTPQQHRLGSVGRAFPGVAVQILRSDPESEDGEILTRGPHVMKGYHQRDDLTLESIDSEDWLHTGDLGRVDRDGYLYITGRSKSLIVLSGGKKVSPEEVEKVLSQGSTVKDICVVGRHAKEGLLKNTEQVWAVVVPEESLAHGLREHPDVLEGRVREEVERLARRMAPYKRPTRLVLHFDEFPRTSTMKIKRSLVNQWLDCREEK